MAWGGTVTGIKNNTVEIIFYEDQTGISNIYTTTVPYDASDTWLSDLVASFIVSLTATDIAAIAYQAVLDTIIIGVVTPTKEIVGDTPVAAPEKAPISIAQPVGIELPVQTITP